MQETDPIVIKFKTRLFSSLNKTASELGSGKWEQFYDKEDDNFVWRNPNLVSSKSSIIMAIDDCFSVSINRELAEIEYLNVQDFVSKFVKENPEFKSFAKKVTKKHGIVSWDGDLFKNIIEQFVGKLSLGIGSQQQLNSGCI